MDHVILLSDFLKRCDGLLFAPPFSKKHNEILVPTDGGQLEMVELEDIFGYQSLKKNFQRYCSFFRRIIEMAHAGIKVDHIHTTNN